MRVFLTGASGFIGAHVTRSLLANGHSIVALVKPDNPMWRLKDVRGQFSVAYGLLGSVDALRSALNEFKPDACIHLAWYAEPGKYLDSEENIVSLIGSLSLLRELIQAGCQQVVMAGTCAEYDTDLGFLREDSPTRPATLYAAAKLSCCLLGQQIAAVAKVNFAWGRVFCPYGPQEDTRRVVPAAIRSLQKAQLFPATLGEQVRDYLHVEDVASAFCTLVETRANGVFNISSGVPVTICQLLETIGNLIGRPELIQFGAQPSRAWEPPFICGGSGRLKGLGWKPNHALVDGLRQTCQWWSTRS
jgi:UDP-glucuronate decarboxylase